MHINNISTCFSGANLSERQLTERVDHGLMGFHEANIGINLQDMDRHTGDWNIGEL